VVLASSADLSRRLWPPEEVGLGAEEDVGVLDRSPEARELYRALILTMLRAVAHQLGMPPPPQSLPNIDSNG
jgi:hypothetical protein